MTRCSLFASGLVSEVSGAVPTFSYRRIGHFGDYFGIQVTYLSGTSTCYQTGATPRFTPVIQNTAASYTVGCQFIGQGSTYTGIYCPNAQVTSIPDGVLTVSYINWAQGQPTPVPYLATFGPSPAPVVETATAGAVATSTSISTSTLSPGYAQTATVYAAGATQTYTSTIIVTQTLSTTNTNFVSSCAALPSSSRSSSSLSSTTSQPAASSSPLASPSRASTSSPVSSPSATGLACPGNNGENYTVESKVFQIQCNYDRDGTSTGPFQPGGGLTGCITLCANTDGCVWSTYYTDRDACYLKSGQGLPNYDTLASGAIWKNSPASSSVTSILSSTSTIASSAAASSSSTQSRLTTTVVSPSPSSSGALSSSSATSAASSSSVISSAASPTVISTNISCPRDDGKTFTASANTFVVECYTDRTNNDLGPASSNPTNFAGCLNACATTPGCQAVSYVPNGACYLKNGLGAPNTNNGIWGARLASAASFTASGAAPSTAVTPSNPIASASSTASTGTTTTSTGPVVTSSVVCPKSNGQTINMGTGTFVIECGVDRVGNDMASSPVYPGTYEACISVCANRDGCVDVSYILNGPCYLKSTAGATNQNDNIIGGRLISSSSSFTASASPSPSSSPATTSSVAVTSPVQTVTVTTTISGTGYQCACTPTGRLGSGPASSSSSSSSAAAASAIPGATLGCPSSDGSTYTSDCGATYAIECYSDRYGQDISGGTSYVNTLNQCIADCDNTNGCIDVSFNPGNPGPCYKKSAIADVRRNDNIFGARQLTDCTKNTKLKLHRKRVVREPTVPKQKIQKRGVYGPDYTYTQGSTTITQTTTSTSVQYRIVTTTPANVGTTTRTMYTTAATTTTVTSGTTVTQTQQTTVTTCPAATRSAVL